MKKITEHLVNSLRGRGAHISIEAALKNFPVAKAGEKIAGLEHSVWMLLYHIWICANDIVEFSIHEGHESPVYPSGYWPDRCCPETEKGWNKLIEDTKNEMERMAELLEDESNDLLAPFPWGTGQNLFREALILIDHNSYHIAQIIDARALLGVPVKDW
ncbi:MAG: DinB family protein [Spirochaetaceae bacterium]|nr:DinB family protein [Spirochaetaceae bacterium]